MAVSSYGLQLYKVLVIEDPELRAQLKPVSWNQSPITDASYLLVFCNYKEIRPEDIDAYIQLTSKERNIPLEKLAGYGDFMKNKLGEKTSPVATNWLQRQPYIALGNLLMACASLKIDACPMEGFEPAEYNKILGLEEKDLEACVLATVGYRHEEDATQYYKKVRKSADDLFSHH